MPDSMTKQTTETKALDTKKTLAFLRQRHPFYLKNEEEWSWYASLKSRQIDPQDALVRGTFESDGEFEKRSLLSEFTPESPLVVTRIMGFLKRNDTEREGADTLNPFIESADQRNRTLKNLEEKSLESSLYFGADFILVDRKSAPRNEEGDVIQPTSAAEEEQLMGSPFLVRYTPDEVVNWQIHEDGYLDWVVLRETKTSQASALDQREEWIIYRVFDRQTWMVYTIKPKKDRDQLSSMGGASSSTEGESPILKANEKDPDAVVIEAQNGAHRLGIVPLISSVPFSDDADSPMQGDSFIKTAARLDLAIFRNESDIAYNLWLHNHPHLIVRTSSPEAVRNWSTNSVLQLNPDEKEDAFYVTPPAEVFEVAQTTVQKQRNGIWILTYQEASDRITQDRTQEQSGIHKRLSFEMAEGALLSHLSDVLAQMDRDILEIVSRYQNSGSNPEPNKPVFAGTIRRNKSHDVFWVSDYVKTLKESGEFIRKSPTLMRHSIERLARALLDTPTGEMMETVSNELLDSNLFMSDQADQLIEWITAMRENGSPSPELNRQLYGRLARLIVGDSDDAEQQETLKTVLDELSEADFSEGNQDEFSQRITQDQQG